MAMSFTYRKLGMVKQVVAAWTSDGDGDASGTTEAVVSGEVIKGVTVPSGTAAPTADYDITVTDENSVNILSGAQDDLTDRHTSNTEEEYFLVLDDAGTPLAQSIHPVVADKLTVTVANAGDTKSGTLYLYVKGDLHGG